MIFFVFRVIQETCVGLDFEMGLGRFIFTLTKCFQLVYIFCICIKYLYFNYI